MTTFTIMQVEAAIRYYLAKEPSKNFHIVSRPARQLAEVYGLMIYNKQMAVDSSTITADQFQVLNDVPASVKAETK